MTRKGLPTEVPDRTEIMGRTRIRLDLDGMHAQLKAPIRGYAQNLKGDVVRSAPGPSQFHQF